MDISSTLKLEKKHTFRVHLTYDEFLERFEELVDTKTKVFWNPFAQGTYKYAGQLSENKFWARQHYYYKDRDMFSTAFAQFSWTTGTIEVNADTIIVRTRTGPPFSQKLLFGGIMVFLGILMTLTTTYGWVWTIIMLPGMFGLMVLSVKYTDSKWFNDFTFAFKK
jgi:hypothetical protein